MTMLPLCQSVIGGRGRGREPGGWTKQVREVVAYNDDRHQKIGTGY